MTRVSTIPAYDSHYLKCTDLQNAPRRVVIASVTLEDLRQATGQRETKIVLSFVGKQKQLVANKTQARTLVDLFGDETDEWAGKAIMLLPSKADNGKETIAIAAVQGG